MSMGTLMIVCGVLLQMSTNAFSSHDNLCYLSHGGSSETFTVNEALPINSIIGSISVIGNVSNGGDIELSLAQHQSNSRWPTNVDDIPIRIEHGTKDLVLIKTLDKEGVEGEQSVIIGIKCKRKYTNDPSIIIPIRILITDANDNEPQWIGLPYAANISEVTVVGSVVMQNIRAIDHDQQGPFATVEYSVEPGPFSHLLRFESPLDGTLTLAAPLDFETLPKFWVTIHAQDQGEPPKSATATVTINVIDSDDQNPRFMDDKYTASLPDFQRAGEELLISPRPIQAEDPDAGIRSPITYSFNSESKENSFFSIDSKFGNVNIKKPLSSSINLPLTLVIRATQLDNLDRYALTTLTVLNRRQLILPDIRFVQSNYTASLLESIPPGHVLLTVHTTRSSPANSDKLLSSNNGLQFQLLDDDEKHFTIRSTGEIVLTKPLDYEKYKTYTFRVMVSDGKQSDVARVTANIINVNEHDPILSQSNYVFHVSESRLRANSVIGEIHASDPDDGDNIQLSLKGPHSKFFTITNEGHLKVKNLKSLNVTECHLIAYATDSGSPPRSASASVVVHFAPQILKSYGRNVDIETGNGQGVDVNMLSHANFFNPSSSSAIILVIVLGVLLGTLFIIIIALTMHVLKHRKYAASATSLTSSSDSSTVNHPHSLPDNASSRGTSLTSIKHNMIVPNGSLNSNVMAASAGTRGVENPIFNMPAAAKRTNVTRIDPDCAVVSDTSSNETVVSGGNVNERTDLIRHIPRSSDSNSPPPPPNLIGTASRISVVKWPQGSIPRRVKKLTWEDQRSNYDNIHHDIHYPVSSSIAVKSNPLSINESSQRQTENDSPIVSPIVKDSFTTVFPIRRTFCTVQNPLPDVTVYF